MPASSTSRLISLDVFRGLAVAGMILVDNPGNDDLAYGPIKHTVWNGWTPADFIFPVLCSGIFGYTDGDAAVPDWCNNIIPISCGGLIGKGNRLRSHIFRYPATSDLRGLKCVNRLTVTTRHFSNLYLRCLFLLG